MAWLNQQKEEWILSLQEPYLGKKGMTKIPHGYGAFWSERISYGNTKSRVAIIAPKRFSGYMVTQLSNVDCIIVRMEKLGVTIVSVYCSIDINIDKSMENVIKECELTKRVVVSMDTNAYHQLWGSVMGRKLQYRGVRRGIELVEILDEHGIEIMNVTPHMATFVRNEVGRKKGKQMSHIDVTICTGKAAERISNWKVVDEVFYADHRGIRFQISCKSRSESEQHKESVVKWKKPSDKMKVKMREALCEKVKYKRRMGTVIEVERFIEKHSKQVREVLEYVFKQDKKKKIVKEMYWWTEEVAKEHKELSRARKRMRRYHYRKFRDEFNQKRAGFRKKVQNAKQDAWRKLMTSITNPWDGLVKIMKATSIGKIQSRTLADTSGIFAEDLMGTLILLGQQFYPKPLPMLDEHVRVEEVVEKWLDNWEEHKVPEITVIEYRKALTDMSVATAPGFDLITNNVIQMLSEEANYEKWYIKMYNMCLENRFFPVEWKKSKIVLIPKVTTLLDTVKAFRPISLTSAFAKLLERIVLSRMNYHLEKGGYMVKNQHAYRKGMSTQTALLEMFKIVQYAMNRKEVCLIVFLDISGAFDRTWHHGIMYKLLCYGVPVYLVAWIKEFLKERSAYFMEGVNQHEVTLEQGCPQGGVLSPILWNVLFNDFLAIPTVVNETKKNVMQTIGYADDAAIVCKARTVEEASELLNVHLRKVLQWSIENRVQFNSSKLAVMTISNRESKPAPASVFFNGTLITEVETYKYLGLTVDNKLTWRKHINNVLDKLAVTNRTFRGIAQQNWGVKLDIFKRIYHSIFYPIMTYGIAIWGWRATHLITCKKFDRVIRIFGLMATRCLRSTPSEFLFQLLETQNFSEILKTEVRRVSVLQFNLVETKRYKVYDRYLARSVREVPQCMDHFYYICRRGVENEVKSITPDDVSRNYGVHPTKWKVPKVLIEDRIAATWNAVDMSGWVVFTDASSSSYSMGWAFMVTKNGFCVYIGQGSLSKCSVFYAEASAIYQAIEYIKGKDEIEDDSEVEIRSDSRSILQALAKPVHTDVVIGKVSDAIKEVLKRGIRLVFKWVPSHSGIFGNDVVDGLAKKACDKHALTMVPVTKREAKGLIKKGKKEREKGRWDVLENRFARTFLPSYDSMKKFIASSPSVAVCQLVVGHNRLNDFVCRKLGLIMSPMCSCGKKRETEAHFIFECTLYQELRYEIWPQSPLDYAVISEDWGKLEEFVRRTGRFRESRVQINKRILEEGSSRGINLDDE